MGFVMKKDKVINIILTFGCLVLLSVIGFGAYVALRPMFLPANAASTESDFKRDNGGEVEESYLAKYLPSAIY